MIRSRLVIFVVILITMAGYGQAQELYVQIDLDTRDKESELLGEEGSDGRQTPDGCSIAHVTPAGAISEFVSNAAILAATGELSADCADTGLTIAPDGTIYFSEDISHDILQVTPGGAVSVLVDAAIIDAAIGTTNDNDNGMHYADDGNLYVADEDCGCIYRVVLPAGTVEVLITEAEIGAVTGNRDSLPDGPFVAGVEGGIVRDADGTLFFADDGEGYNAGVADENSRDSIIMAVPNGGGYTVSVLADEADFAAALGNGTSGPSGSPCSDLDLDIDSIDGSTLYVLDDGGCGEDGVLAVNKASGAVSVIAYGTDINAATGVDTDLDDLADLEGGIAVAADGTLFVGDSSWDNTDNKEMGNIVRISGGGSTTLWVSDAQLVTAIGDLYPGLDATFNGGLDVIPEQLQPDEAIPVLGGWGIAILIVAIAGLGLFVMRRFSS